MDKLTIGNVAEQALVHIKTLRYYERRGLIAMPPRSRSNDRLYPEETVRRVRFMECAQALGFSLHDIKALLSLRAAPEVGCADVRARAETNMQDIDDKIASLRVMKATLSTLVAQCSGEGSLTDWPIVTSLEMKEVTS